MDAAVVAICCQFLGTGSCNMYFPAIPDFICCSPSPLARCARPRQAARQMINNLETARYAHGQMRDGVVASNFVFTVQEGAMVVNTAARPGNDPFTHSPYFE